MKQQKMIYGINIKHKNSWSLPIYTPFYMYNGEKVAISTTEDELRDIVNQSGFERLCMVKKVHRANLKKRKKQYITYGFRVKGDRDSFHYIKERYCPIDASLRDRLVTYKFIKENARVNNFKINMTTTASLDGSMKVENVTHKESISDINQPIIIKIEMEN